MSGLQPLFLGLDASTQALKASLLDQDLSVQAEIEVRFDRDLSHYGTQGGTLLVPDGSGIVYSPVMMNVEAVDLLFARIHESKWPVERIRGISAAGQQHASVYWSHSAEETLGSIDANERIAPQLKAAFSRDAVPNWQDSSTLDECRAFEETVGGPKQLAHLTGSKAHTRFTGPQIMRFRKTEPAAYANTARISLVSSLMTTLLCLDGTVKGIDESDACGMNLWDMSTPERGWAKPLLELVAGTDDAADLEKKLGAVESDGGRVVGHIGQYYIDRFGFSKDCIVCPGTGDNPATFLSFTLREGEGLASLGTSDTILVSTSAYNPDAEFHAFFHPAQVVAPSIMDGASRSSTPDAMRYFNMLVYKNGSLAREYVRDQHYDGQWDKFNASVESRRPKGPSDLPKTTGFWWLKPDIIPSNASGIFKYERTGQETKLVKDFSDTDTNGVAMLESQMLNYRYRSSAILRDGSATQARDEKLARIYASGGASANATICRVMADVLDCSVCKPVRYDGSSQQWRDANWNACSVGAAYKAAWAYARHADPSQSHVRFDDFVAKAAERRRQARNKLEAAHEASSTTNDENLHILEEGVAIVAKPDKDRAAAYTASLGWWSNLEQEALQLSRKSAVAS